MRATALAFLACLAFAGCGDDKEAVVKTVTVDRPPPTAVEDLAEPPPAPIFKRCDDNITARKGTTNCAFASNAFYEYWNSGQSSTIRAYSPLVGTYFRLRCTAAGGGVVCRTRNRGVVRFPQTAVDSYSAEQAQRYARKHDVGPDSITPPPPPASAPESDAGFCATHDCIDNFEEGNGSIVQCDDGMWSQSGGIQGACSGHGGVRP